jgi:antitoxin (DNA-binding transcriptional repressor) of toxin-antitoxin stability system
MKTNEIGLREARVQLGPIANRADLAGEITYLTRNGRKIAAIVPVHIAQEHVMPRNVISTNAHIDVTDDYADQVREILDNPGALIERETCQRNEHGQIDYYTRVVSYDAGGGARWAVDYFDPASREVEEFDDQAAAEARYEEMVRASAGDLGYDYEGEQVEFTETDVAGVPGYVA